MIFKIIGDTYKVRGTITVLSFDNLSAQLIGGYKALHAAFRKCRYCMAIDDDMQRKVGLKHMIMLINKSHTVFRARLSTPYHKHIQLPL